jgi:hypothetical protein
VKLENIVEFGRCQGSWNRDDRGDMSDGGHRRIDTRTVTLAGARGMSLLFNDFWRSWWRQSVVERDGIRERKHRRFGCSRMTGERKRMAGEEHAVWSWISC